MAELVHLRLENSLPELEEMERIGLFSRDEIRKIVKKRKTLEYKLHRISKRKEDYLKYIEYEMNLLNLISKRRERLLCESKKQEIDKKVAKRVSKLFKVVISRFPEDQKLMLDQIQFCKKMKWYDNINVLYTQMLKIHSRNSSLWVMAAKWEMEERRSPENARKLLQRGVLMNPKSKILWREYYRMELMYIDLIKKRREVLHLQKIEDPNINDNDAILSGKIPNIVFDKALEEIEDDVEFALSFIQICMEFDFAMKHIDYILDKASEVFPDKEEILDALAKRPLLNIKEKISINKEQGIKKKITLGNMTEEIFSLYEKAVSQISTEKMWNFYIEFVLSLINSSKESKKRKLQDSLIQIMKRAATYECLSECHYSNWIDLLFEKGNDCDALSISLEAARKWKKVDSWSKALTYHIQRMQSFPQIYLYLLEAINDALEKDSIVLWKLGVDWLSIFYPEKLEEFFEIGIKQSKEISIPLKEMYLEATALKSDIYATRKLYKKFKKLGPLSHQIVKKMISIEKGQLKPSIALLRKYFEEGLQEFGDINIDIWLDYMKFEVENEQGNSAATGTIIWRAKKTLQPEYINDFQMRLTEFITGSRRFENGVHGY